MNILQGEITKILILTFVIGVIIFSNTWTNYNTIITEIKVWSKY